MPSRMSEFLAENGTLDEATFLARYPHPFLVTEGQGSTGLSGRVTEGLENGTKVTDPKAEDAPPATDDWVVAVRPRDGSKFATIVTVGRGEECDVRLAHPLVSKKHAYFKQEPDGRWAVCDVGSTNGTFADGSRLEAHKPHCPADSEALRFGPGVKYRFFGAKALHAYLSLRARIKS